MSCDRDICATNEYNGIDCDECCVSYDTAVQREQDAYDSGFAKAIEDVLEIIDRSTEYAKELDETFSDTANGMLAASSAIHKAVLALKEGEE